MLTWIHACYNGSSGRRAGGIRAVSSLEEASSLGESIQIWGIDLRVFQPNGIPVLLIACYEENVRAGVFIHIGTNV